jgi:hypothetical protein
VLICSTNLEHHFADHSLSFGFVGIWVATEFSDQNEITISPAVVALVTMLVFSPH